MSHSHFDRIALSTCWCSHRHTDGLAMMEEIRELGFARVELGHGVPVSLVPGVLRAVDEGLVEVGSVHNFCPLPVEADRAAPNFFQPGVVEAIPANARVGQAGRGFPCGDAFGQCLFPVPLTRGRSGLGQ
jgi:hypothetical protein